MAPSTRKTRASTRPVAPPTISKYLPQPRKENDIRPGAIYVHSAQPTAEKGYILHQWFEPTKTQTASMKSARIAQSGYWVRIKGHTLQPALKCIIKNCPLCPQATNLGFNPEWESSSEDESDDDSEEEDEQEDKDEDEEEKGDGPDEEDHKEQPSKA